MSSITSKNVSIALFTVLLTFGFYVVTAPQAEAASETVSTMRVKTERASSTKATASVDTSCMAAAVTEREADLLSAWTKLSSGLTEGLTDRSEALVAAWSSTDSKERLTMNKAAWSTWKETKKALHKTFKSDRKAAWDSFKSTAKAECKVTVPKEEALEKVASDTIAM